MPLNHHLEIVLWEPVSPWTLASASWLWQPPFQRVCGHELSGFVTGFDGIFEERPVLLH